MTQDGDLYLRMNEETRRIRQSVFLCSLLRQENQELTVLDTKQKFPEKRELSRGGMPQSCQHRAAFGAFERYKGKKSKDL